MTVSGLKPRRTVVAAATLSQATPVQNTWYTIVDSKRYCDFIYASFAVATTGENLEARITIGAYSEVIAWAASAATIYKTTIDITPTLAGWFNLDTGTQTTNHRHIEGDGLKIEIRKTSASGTGTLTCRAIYEEVT